MTERLRSNANLFASAVVFGLLFLLFLADRVSFFDPRLLPVYGFGFCLSLVGDAAVLALHALLPLWLLGRYARLFYAVCIPIEFAFVCIQWFVRSQFNMYLSGSWVGILVASSPEEIRWFFWHYASVASFAILAAAIVAAVCLVKALSVVRKTSATRVTVIAAVVVAALLVCECRRREVGTVIGLAKTFPAIWLVPNSILHFSEQYESAKMVRHPQLPDTVRLDRREGAPVVGAFVLGESATRSHWSLYGYGRATSPEMDAIRGELVVFSDLLTPSPQTCAAMRDIFTARTCERSRDFRFSLSQVLRVCGFDLPFYSGHGSWDRWYSGEACSFSGCDPLVWTTDVDEDSRFDSALLPHFQKHLGNSSTNCIVFLHMMGSHLPFNERYPADDAPFGERTSAGVMRTQVDHYDNTIWHTDRFLGEIVRKLKALHRPAWMIYVSDHGETPSANGWRMATDNDLWEVPFFVWTSPEFDAAYPERIAALRRAKDKPLQSDQLLYGLLRFMGVKGLGNAPEEDFLDDSFKPRDPRVILGGAAVYEKRSSPRDPGSCGEGK